jgi:glutamyl-tRNA synthetase
MSKRDKEKALKQGIAPPEIDVHDFRIAGYVPEAVVNFISLLGWNPGEDREQFDLEEMVRLFSVDRIGKTNAKFDREKLLSFNTDWAARLPADRLLALFKDFVGLNPSVPAGLRTADDATLDKVLEACKGFRTFPDVIKKAGFLFVPDDDILYDPEAVKKVLAKNEGEGYAMLEALLPRLEAVTDWSAGPLEALVHAVVEEKQTKLGNVAQPIRVAVSGTTISPSIHETLALLGREKTLARVRRCLAQQT